MLLNGYNCTQSGPLTIEWSAQEDATEYLTTNQLTSTDADNIKGYASEIRRINQNIFNTEQQIGNSICPSIADALGICNHGTWILFRNHWR